MDRREIGGYFELGVPRVSRFPYSGAVGFQSARAALLALLAVRRPSRIWMPRYICDAMTAPLAERGYPIHWYDLTQHLGVPDNVSPAPGDILLYVNYFGLCNDAEKALRARLMPDQLVFDRCQAFFRQPSIGIACLYSPRKFFGLPDGGYLVAPDAVPVPETEDTESMQRMRHILSRVAYPAGDAYGDFRAAEASLSDATPLRISRLTVRLLEGIDFAIAARRRRANFDFLCRRLDNRNRLAWLTAGAVEAPLCYPYWPQVPVSKSGLAAQGIYIPTYWKEVLGRTVPGSVEAQLAEHCLPLPCDQRYDEGDLERMIDALTST